MRQHGGRGRERLSVGLGGAVPVPGTERHLEHHRVGAQGMELHDHDRLLVEFVRALRFACRPRTRRSEGSFSRITNSRNSYRYLLYLLYGYYNYIAIQEIIIIYQRILINVQHVFLMFQIRN